MLKKIILSVAVLATMSHANTQEIEECSLAGKLTTATALAVIAGIPTAGLASGFGFIAGLGLNDYKCGNTLDSIDSKSGLSSKENYIPMEDINIESTTTMKMENPVVKKSCDKKLTKQADRNIEMFALFDNNSYKPNFINGFLSNLDNDKIKGITVVGHASKSGTKEHNYNLSLKRAIEIQKVIVKSIDKRKVGVNVKSNSELLSDDCSMNRRVQLIIDYK